MFGKKTKKPKTKKDLKLRVAKSSSKAPAPSPPVVETSSPPTPPPPACVLNLEPLPWSEWTWDTDQHFYFRARMGADGWEYEYKLPPDYMEKRNQMWQRMNLPSNTRSRHNPANHGRGQFRSVDEIGMGSSSEGDTIHSSVEFVSDSGSESNSSSATEGSSEDGYGTEARAPREPKRPQKKCSASPVIIVTTKHESGEVIVEVIDSKPTRRRNGGIVRESSDWGYTSEDEW